MNKMELTQTSQESKLDPAIRSKNFFELSLNNAPYLAEYLKQNSITTLELYQSQFDLEPFVNFFQGNALETLVIEQRLQKNMEPPVEPGVISFLLYQANLTNLKLYSCKINSNELKRPMKFNPSGVTSLSLPNQIGLQEVKLLLTNLALKTLALYPSSKNTDAVVSTLLLHPSMTDLTLAEFKISSNTIKSLFQHPSLTKLNLKTCTIIGPAELADFPENMVLKSFRLHDKNFSKAPWLSILPKCSALTALGLPSCGLTTMKLELQKMFHLKIFNLDGNKSLTNIGIGELSCFALTKLILSNCALRSKDVKALLGGRYLKHSLKTLCLDENHLGDKVVDSLSQFPALTDLSLRACKMYNEGAFALASRLKLKKLDFTQNSISDNVIIAFAFTSIVELRLSFYKPCSMLFILGFFLANNTFQNLWISGIDAGFFKPLCKKNQVQDNFSVWSITSLPTVLINLIQDYAQLNYSYELFCQKNSLWKILIDLLEDYIKTEFPSSSKNLCRLFNTPISTEEKSRFVRDLPTIAKEILPGLTLTQLPADYLSQPPIWVSEKGWCQRGSSLKF